MKFQNLSVKRLFGRVAMELVLSMSGITIALFLVTKQIAVLLTGGTLLLCALVGIFVLTQAFGKRLSQFTADLCQTLDHMIAGNEAPQRPEDSETQLARIGHRLARLYQILIRLFILSSLNLDISSDLSGLSGVEWLNLFNKTNCCVVFFILLPRSWNFVKNSKTRYWLNCKF